MQTKKQAHLETMTNQALGLIAGWLVVYFIFPMIWHLPREQFATISSIIFFCISYTRMYLVRRIYNWWSHIRPNKGL